MHLLATVTTLQWLHMKHLTQWSPGIIPNEFGNIWSLFMKKITEYFQPSSERTKLFTDDNFPSAKYNYKIVSWGWPILQVTGCVCDLHFANVSENDPVPDTYTVSTMLLAPTRSRSLPVRPAWGNATGGPITLWRQDYNWFSGVSCSPFKGFAWLRQLHMIIPPLQQSWKRGILVSPCMSVCGQNHLCSVSFAILAWSISYLRILSTNLRRCGVCQDFWKISKSYTLVGVGHSLPICMYLLFGVTCIYWSRRPRGLSAFNVTLVIVNTAIPRRFLCLLTGIIPKWNLNFGNW